MSHPLRCSPHQEAFTFGEHPRKPTFQNIWFEKWNMGSFCDGLASNIVVQYSVGTIITHHGRITAREYMDRLGNPVQPMIQTLFLNDAVFQHDNAPIHTAGTVQSWFEEHEGELQHLPLSALSPDLNITEQLWSIFETRMRN
jgi:hypothetical protein